MSDNLTGHSNIYLRRLNKNELLAITESYGKYKGCTIRRARYILTNFKASKVKV